MIRVLIVDDSLTERVYLEHIIGSEPDLEIAGSAVDGREAIALAAKVKPDVILMDIELPHMDGYAATRQIMQTNPVPIIIISARVEAAKMTKSFEALSAGAVCALPKPTGPGAPGSADMAKKIVQTVKLMDKIKMKDRARGRSVDNRIRTAQSLAFSPKTAGNRPSLILMGASTGGPPVINTILSNLNPSFSIPILIVQHISNGFLNSMVHWIEKNCHLKVKVADDHELIAPGMVYFAPEDRHMAISRANRILLSDDPPEHGVKPAVSRLFRSVISSRRRIDCVGVLLTGMGKDGAEELRQMKAMGNLTLAQNKETCVVFGMPGEAVRLHGASHIFAPHEIGRFLNQLTG